MDMPRHDGVGPEPHDPVPFWCLMLMAAVALAAAMVLFVCAGCQAGAVEASIDPATGRATAVSHSVGLMCWGFPAVRVEVHAAGADSERGRGWTRSTP